MKKVLQSKSRGFKTTLVAPCGLNCRLCRAYIRDKNSCSGCRADDAHKLKYCVTCKIKNCRHLDNGSKRFCFDCEEFPCAKIKHLDKRYRTKYQLSVISNLEVIKHQGVRHFINEEKENWQCPNCAEVICMHKEVCIFCGWART